MGTVRWHIDPRPASWWTKSYVRLMWWTRDKRAFEGEQRTRARAEKLQRAGDCAPTRLTRLVTAVSTRTSHGMTVWTARPRLRSPIARVVYLHGGGYIHPLTRDYWRLVRTLATHGIEVVLPAYPLAPRHTVDEVVPRLVGVISEAGPSLPTVLMGDSAGGALVLVLGSHPGLSLPVGLVCLCPWLDAELREHEVTELEASDPMLAESGLRAAGRWWAGLRTAADPLVSPVRQRLDGLPPIDILIGDRDILRPAVDDLARRAQLADVTLDVHEHRAMFHVWMTRAIPEARRTRRLLVHLVRKRATEGPHEVDRTRKETT
ncbi:MAG: alpha/beta hydrolase fold domain-containing protein [Nocardioides sp.]